MKKPILTLLACVWLLNQNCHSQLIDSFSDFDFTNNPSWMGDASCFMINSDTSLQLNAPTGTSDCHLVTSSNAIGNAIYEFHIQLLFNPSPSNYVRIYLTSDQEDLSDSLHGYFVQIGGQSGASDEVSLYYQNGLAITKIIDGMDSTVAFNPSLRCQVTRDMVGNWSLNIDTSQTGAWMNQGVAFHDITLASSYFGWKCVFTSTRRDKFMMDNIAVSGGLYKDQFPPSLLHVHGTKNRVELVFNEPLNPQSGLFSLEGLGVPDEIWFSGNVVQLEFNQDLENGQFYKVLISEVQDTSGNIMNDSMAFFPIHYPSQGEFREVIINEIFADPSPVIGLPEVEYIELRNNTSKIYILDSCRITDGKDTSSYFFGKIEPSQFQVICHVSDTGLFHVPTIGLEEFPNLNNDSDSLLLISAYETLLDSVNYSVKWHELDKRDGGWSLEKVHPNSICFGEEFWKSSESNFGGTPGLENSVKRNEKNPVEVNIHENSEGRWKLVFNQPVQSFIKAKLDGFSGDLVRNSSSEYVVDWRTHPPRGVEYEIILADINSCFGETIAVSSSIYLPLTRDVLINEVLFNPHPDGVDFIELFNRTNHTISIEDWSFLEVNVLGDSITKRMDGDIQLAPLSYVYLSEDSNRVKHFYPSAKDKGSLETDLPSMSDDEGEIILLDHLNAIMDQFNYNEGMHHIFVDEVEGVSLERVHHFPDEITNPNSWHSSSTLNETATPGQINSQHQSGTVFQEMFHISPNTITPNNDGLDDVLSIILELNVAHLGAIQVYDSRGSFVYSITSEATFGIKNIFFWDGRNLHGNMVASGLYLVVFMGVTENGEKVVEKKTVAVYVE